CLVVRYEVSERHGAIECSSTGVCYKVSEYRLPVIRVPYRTVNGCVSYCRPQAVHREVGCTCDRHNGKQALKAGVGRAVIYLFNHHLVAYLKRMGCGDLYV